MVPHNFVRPEPHAVVMQIRREVAFVLLRVRALDTEAFLSKSVIAAKEVSKYHWPKEDDTPKRFLDFFSKQRVLVDPEVVTTEGSEKQKAKVNVTPIESQEESKERIYNDRAKVVLSFFEKRQRIDVSVPRSRLCRLHRLGGSRSRRWSARMIVVPHVMRRQVGLHGSRPIK